MDVLINDYRSKPRNFLVFVSLCVLLFCILLRVFLTKSTEKDSSVSKTIKETTIISEKIIEPPKVEELKPILNTVENIDITKTLTSKGEENVNWGVVLFGLFCLLLLGLCFYLLYLLYKSKYTSNAPEVSDGDPIVVLIKDPVPSKPKAPVAAPTAAPAPATNTADSKKYERANIRVMDAPVERKYGDLTIKYEPDPLTLQYPDETIYDIRNAPQQTYTQDQQYSYQQPQQQYYVEDRPMPFDYVSQEEPKRRNVAFYDTYSAYEQRACAIPPIDYDAIGCSNTRHGERCQCETCV